MPEPGPEFVGLLQEIFNAKKIKTDVPFPILPAKPKRTLGDVALSAEAQRVYDPAQPSVPSKAPPGKMLETGTGPAMDLEASRYLK